MDIALRMLMFDRGKLAIALAGVTFAVTLVLVQLGLFRGLLDNATVTIEHADADLWITSKNTPNVDFPHYFADGAVARVRSIEGVEHADNLLVAFVGMQLPSGAEETIVVYGVERPERWHLPWSLSRGDVAALRRPRTMVLDESAAKRFGVFSIGDRREVFGRRMNIVGASRDAVSFTTMPMAFTSLEAAQDLAAMFSGRTAYVLVKLAPGADRARVVEEARRRLPYNDVYTREAWASRTRDYWVASTGLGLNMAFTVFLGVLVGITVVAQTLYGFTLDHTRELGTLKALGASTTRVCAMIATQAAVAGVSGFVLAMPCVALLREAAKTMALRVMVTGPSVLFVFAGTIFLCVAASLLSFRRIAAIDPALVFRS